jgi:hypothetical protein
MMAVGKTVLMGFGPQNRKKPIRLYDEVAMEAAKAKSPEVVPPQLVDATP